MDAQLLALFAYVFCLSGCSRKAACGEDRRAQCGGFVLRFLALPKVSPRSSRLGRRLADTLDLRSNLLLNQSTGFFPNVLEAIL